MGFVSTDSCTVSLLREGGALRENPPPRTYQLRIFVEKPVVIAIGKLGSFRLPAGEYAYTGSGGKNVEARVARHLSKSKKLRWHIDYLLSDSAVRVTGVSLFTEAECAVNQTTAGRIPVLRFGSTDCRNGCASHLKYLGFPRRCRTCMPPHPASPKGGKNNSRESNSFLSGREGR